MWNTQPMDELERSDNARFRVSSLSSVTSAVTFWLRDSRTRLKSVSITDYWDALRV